MLLWLLLSSLWQHFCEGERLSFGGCGLMALHTRNVWRNVVMLSIEQQNNINHCKRKTMWVYPRLQIWFEQLVVNHYQNHLCQDHFGGRQGYIWIHLWSRWPSAYLPSDHRGKASGRWSLEVSYWEFVQNRLVNTIGRLIDICLSLRAMRLAAALTRTSYTISRGSIGVNFRS